jgi:hypothetical protein
MWYNLYGECLEKIVIFPCKHYYTGGLIMITFFNRRELYKGYVLLDFKNILQILKNAKIKFPVKVKTNRNGNFYSSNTGAGIPNFGQSSMDLTTKYYIYVHKNDYEHAAHIIK